MSGSYTIKVSSGNIGGNGYNGGDSPVREHLKRSFDNLDVNSILNLITSRARVRQKINIKDPEKVERLINEIISSGAGALQVITDFDATLSCYHKDGKKCNTSYGVISGSKQIPDEVKARGAALYAKYYPYESDTTINLEERKAKLAEWYELKHDNYMNSNVSLTSTEISELVREGGVFLRDGAQELLRKLHRADIPTLVFSAGNGNSIEELFKLDGVDFPNIRVFSNFMEFDATTKEFKGFRKPIIHPANKTQEIVLECDPKHFENLRERRTALLLGDNIADPEMANGLPEDKILKIGFLNYNIDQQLESFMDAYDIVLVDDQTMDLPNALVDLIVKDNPVRP